MEIFRYSRNAFGQPLMEGISYDLLWVFAGLSAAVIIGHLIYKQLQRKTPEPLE